MSLIIPSRRSFLRASGVSLGLPMLESMPRTASADESEGRQVSRSKRRMVAVNVELGLHGPNMTPTQSGSHYELSRYLKVLERFRNDFTYISGASHPEVDGGHASRKSFLTGMRHPLSAGFRNSISIDQLAAERLGAETRFASLSLSTSSAGISWSRSGVEIPAESRPSRVFKKLFVEGTGAEKILMVERLRKGQSVLDAVSEKARQMQRRVNGRDRQKLEQYFNSVREAEKRLVKAAEWEKQPKPVVDAKEPRDVLDPKCLIQRLDLMYDMMHLAIQTDSTRFITLSDPGRNLVPAITGVDTDHHMLSHHAKDPGKIAQLAIVETAIVEALGRFLDKLAESNEAESSLLDQTMVLFGSNLGNASNHDTRNMPILLAGGGFRHGQHLAFDQQNNYPLTNLFVSMLQQLGLEIDRFVSSTGTMRGLHAA
ncbi:MAG: DUF1552 domain-containing protein [Rubripirellula sp.]|nr:DUF1552 domain-containing protein [Rubripirellula sp.]